MKNFKLLATIMIAIFLVSSCSKDEVQLDESYDQSSALKKAPIVIPIYTNVNDDTWPVDDACADPVMYDLFGGQTILLGTVSILPVGTDLYVKYELNQEQKDAGCVITETHLYAGPLADLLGKNGSPKIGHFPYAWEGESTAVIMQIPADEECEDVIAAHAVVICGGDDETAWAKGGEPVFALKSLMEVSEGGMPNEGGSYMWSIAGAEEGKWCDNFMYLPLLENLDQTLQLVYYNDGVTPYGDVFIELDGDVVRFTVTSDYVDGWVDNSHLFVGSVQYLNSIGICNHGSFPFQDNDPKEEHVFEFPASILLDGNEFGGSRWGWYIHYCSPC